MAITLIHTIAPARDKEASACFFASLFSLRYDGPTGHFAPVRVNAELPLDFDDADSCERPHYDFHVATAIRVGKKILFFLEPGCANFPDGAQTPMASRIY